ncbi:hypothetical protein ACIQFP_10475 [Nocardiopsis alba]|uniref:hypothetical protein n=1 Tax=Nocardiopsis alba TaxID=53437 RepID=UPI00382FB498
MAKALIRALEAAIATAGGRDLWVGARDMGEPPEMGYGELVDLVPFEEDNATVALIIN